MIFREVEDRDLIAKARRGHVDAYNVLVSRWEKRVYNYLLRLVRNREDALDLTQDVFLKAFQNLKKLDDAGRFGGWLFRIAHNEAFSLLRKNRPEGEMVVEPSTGDSRGRLFSDGVEPGRRERVGAAFARPAGGRAAEGLSRVQIRGNGRDPVLSCIDCQEPRVYRARPPEKHSGSNRCARC